MWIFFVSSAGVFCHEYLLLSFQPFLPIFFRAMRSGATVTVACPQSLCLGDVAVCTLWMLFQPPNPAAQWNSHCPRAQWTSGAVAGFGYFRLQPKSSMCFLVLETSPSSKRGKPRWGAAPEVTLNLLSPCDFPRQHVLPLPHSLSFPGLGLISQDLNLPHFQQSSPFTCSPASRRVAEPVPALASAGIPGCPHAVVADAEAALVCAQPQGKTSPWPSPSCCRVCLPGQSLSSLSRS